MASANELLNTGLEHHRAGRFDQAHAAYLQAHSADPTSAAVLSLLGAVCINLHRWQEAHDYLAEALKHDPTHQPAHDNLGVLLGKLKQYDAAVIAFRRAAELSPDSAQTQLNLAAALERAGQSEAAITTYRIAARLAPQSTRAHAELARLLHEAGRVTESVQHFRQLARLKSEDPRARFELAAALAQAGQIGEAIAAYQETLRLKPDSAESCVNLAQLCVDKRDYQQAVDWARQAIGIRPALAEAHLNLGVALMKLGQLEDARASLGEAMRLKPAMAPAHNNLGNVLVDLDRIDEAVFHYHRAIELDPRNADAMYNLGIALVKLGEIEAGSAEFDRALVLKPNYAEAHHNRASSQLLLGRLAEGLEEYEWRFRSRDFPIFRPRWKVWEGGSVAGRTIALVAEQGLGDTLQFVRYAALLAERGAKVVVECPAVLHPLLARTLGVTRWLTSTDEAPEVELCVPLMSMPLRCGTTLETIPAQVPYIFAESERIERWGQKLSDWDEFKVGIVWQGNAKAPGDAQRSIPLVSYEPLAKVAGVRLFNLQKGPGSAQLEPIKESWGVVDFGSELDPPGSAFLDTAAIMKNLDLVITSDTSIAHLAGALGVPVWVVLQKVPDWRWLLETDQNPWYPTMRVFRQAERGDWDEVFQRVREALEAEVAGR